MAKVVTTALVEHLQGRILNDLLFRNLRFELPKLKKLAEGWALKNEEKIVY